MTLVAVLALSLLGTRAWATHAALECTTDGAHNWTVTAVGPVSATCPGGGDCTKVTYTITPNQGLVPDHVAILAEHDATVLIPESRFVSAPCIGDSVTFLGIHDCSTQAVRLNKNAETGVFELGVQGLKDIVGSSIVVKKGRVVEQCGIASLGKDDFNPNAQRTTNEEITFKGCTVSIPTDPVTGEGGEATLSGEHCVFVANGLPVGIAKLIVDGKDVGNLTFGEGFASSGTASCTTKIVSGRLYTWCTCARLCSNNAARSCTVNADCVTPGVCSPTTDPKPPCS